PSERPLGSTPHHPGGLGMPHESTDRDAARRRLPKPLATRGAAATGETGGGGQLVAQPQTRGGGGGIGERARARHERLTVKDVGGEVLAYALERARAHSLNAVAAAVWHLCNGTRSVPEIAAATTGRVGVPVTADAVRCALTELGQARLLARPIVQGGLTRRQLIRRLGTAAASPLVVSIVAPTAARGQA